MSDIFISYRRSDSQDVTGRIYDHLASHFTGRVFKDVDSIPLGANFRTIISDAIARCCVLIAVIGPDWLDVHDESGRRLDDPDDYVRIELETAIDREIPLIPLYVNGASPPPASRLPASLQPIAYRNGTTARSDPDFRNDIRRLITNIEQELIRRSPVRSIEPLAEYIYLDHRRIHSYAEQIAIQSCRVPNWAPQPARQSGSPPKSTHENITAILNHLNETQQLSHIRPLCDGWNHELFVLEELTAEKAILPIRPNEVVSSLRELAVWISDPAPEHRKMEPYWASGALLYLIESYWNADAERFGTTMSGLSALRCIVQDMVSAGLLVQSSQDHLGWPMHDRPREILEKLGAAFQPQRRIRTLYRYRYVSDEHYFTDTDGDHRSYDVYGYPIFIKAV